MSSSMRVRELDRITANIEIASIVFSRYTGCYWPEILKFARVRSATTRVFLDDNLLEVPDVLGGSAAAIYNHPDRRAAMLTTLAECDCVVASTSALRRQLAVYPHRSITHTPIYCSTTANEITRKPPTDGRVRIGYMASRWHQHDLDFIGEAIDSALTYNPNATFTVFGFDWSMSPVAQKHGGRVTSLTPSAISYMAFRQKLNGLHWDIGLAPLRPIPYNQCKANTKWVEYTCASVSTIAANYPPYQDLPEGSVALCEPDDVEEWAAALDNLINDDKARDALRSGAQNLAGTTFNIYEHAHQIIQIFTP